MGGGEGIRRFLRLVPLSRFTCGVCLGLKSRKTQLKQEEGPSPPWLAVRAQNSLSKSKRALG
jgi:hypothetical protein